MARRPRVAYSGDMPQPSYIVNAGERDEELVEFLAHRLHVSKKGARRLLDARVVFVNDKRVWMARHVLRTRRPGRGSRAGFHAQTLNDPFPSSLRIARVSSRISRRDSSPMGLTAWKTGSEARHDARRWRPPTAWTVIPRDAFCAQSILTRRQPSLSCLKAIA